MHILQEYDLSIKNKRILYSDSPGKFTRIDGEFSKNIFSSLPTARFCVKK
jgi:hypothetical protein